MLNLLCHSLDNSRSSQPNSSTIRLPNTNHTFQQTSRRARQPRGVGDSIDFPWFAEAPFRTSGSDLKACSRSSSRQLKFHCCRRAECRNLISWKRIPLWRSFSANNPQAQLWMAGKPSSPKTPTSGLVLLECRPTTKRAQAMDKELRMAWGIAVERLSAAWGDWCLACGQKRSITVCISQCNRKSLLYPASVERDRPAHPCPLSGQPFRSSFCVPDDSIHTVDSVQISLRSLFLKRLLSPSLYRHQRLVST